MAETAKAKKTPGPKSDAQQRFRRLVAQGIREGSLIALIALTIYLAMALATYSPEDPAGPPLVIIPPYTITLAAVVPG